jgi:2-oxoglutarate dehydrogenase E2 component (dihydrolipoamide succinyltransferase)
MADILTPTLGESVSEATVARWTKKAGEAVKKDEILVELETDKVSLEVAAPADGVLAEITAPEGANVVPGQKLGVVSAGASASAATPAPAAQPAAKPAAPAPAPAPAAAAAGGAPIEVKTPVMGESVAEGTIATWNKKIGDQVTKDEVLVEIETDKVAVEVSAPADGVLVQILSQNGATVTPGQVIARIAPGAGATAPAPAAAPAAPAPASTPAERPLAPSVQRIVTENNLDASTIQGTGKDGRITKGDALQATEAPRAPAAAAAPAAAPAAPRPPGEREERVRMTRLRQTIAKRLKDAQNTAAMLTTFNEVDMTAVMELRALYKDAFEKRHGVKLGFMSFFVKACVAALKEVPAVNAEIDGQDMVYKNHYDLGVAVGTERGLVVPVVRDCDRMSLADIEKAIATLGVQARNGALTLDQLQGGTFTISNGGVYGSLMSTPILNAPQSGILGMHKIQERPVVVNKQIMIRPMMYLALSYDHRVVDGKEAVTFLVSVKDHIEDPQRLVLDL